MEGADKVGVSRDPRVRIRLACRGGLTKGRNRDGSGLSALGERENASLLQGASGHNNWHQEDGSGGEELVPGYNEFVSCAADDRWSRC
eukprot:3931879-Rhodomonas_salina.2